MLHTASSRRSGIHGVACNVPAIVNAADVEKDGFRPPESDAGSSGDVNSIGGSDDRASGSLDDDAEGRPARAQVRKPMKQAVRPPSLVTSFASPSL